MNTNLRFWIIGVILAITGVVLARVISGMYSDRAGIQLVLYFLGVIVALSGLGVILFGLRKK
jgi:hypothetical protein